MKKAVNVESNFFDISLKEQMLSVKKVGFDGVFLTGAIQKNLPKM